MTVAPSCSEYYIVQRNLRHAFDKIARNAVRYDGRHRLDGVV